MMCLQSRKKTSMLKNDRADVYGPDVGEWGGVGVWGRGRTPYCTSSVHTWHGVIQNGGDQPRHEHCRREHHVDDLVQGGYARLHQRRVLLNVPRDHLQPGDTTPRCGHNWRTSCGASHAV